MAFYSKRNKELLATIATVNSHLSGRIRLDFAKFFMLRFPYKNLDDDFDSDYATEWADRFASGSEWAHADMQSKRVLMKINTKKYSKLFIEDV